MCGTPSRSESCAASVVFPLQQEPITAIFEATGIYGNAVLRRVPVAVLALGSGERALRAVAGLLSDTFRALVPFAAPRPLLAPRVRPEPPLLTVGMTVLSVMRHRGPPLAA